MFEAISGYLIGIASGFLILEGIEVLSLRPKKLIRKTPVAVKSASLIVAFVNLILLVSYTLSQTVVPFIIANQGIIAILAILGMTLLVGFGISSAITSRVLYHRIIEFVKMTNTMQSSA
jgi:hypothetical protein